MSRAKQITRRELLAAGGATLFAGVMAKATSAGGPSTVLTLPLSESDRRLSVASPGDAPFLPQVRSLFPGLADDTNFQRIAPVSFLVTNDSGPAVKAMSARFAVTLNDGSLFELPMFFYQQANARVAISAVQRFILPQRTRLVTPFVCAGPEHFRLSGLRWSRLLNASRVHAFLAAQLASGVAGVNITIDAAIYDDDVLIGPDTQLLSKYFAARKRAEHDEAAYLIQAMKGGSGAKDQVATILRDHHHSDGIAPPDLDTSKPVRVWYYKARANQARVLTKHLRATDVGTLTQTLVRLRGQRKPNIHRVNG